jgi:hypothetical protein
VSVRANPQPGRASGTAEHPIARQDHPTRARRVRGVAQRFAERPLLALVANRGRWMFEQHELGLWRQRSRQVYAHLFTGRER